MLTEYHLDNKEQLEQVLRASVADKISGDISYRNASDGQNVTFIINNDWVVKLGLKEEDYYSFDDQRDLIKTIRPFITGVELPNYEALRVKTPIAGCEWIHIARYQMLKGIVLHEFEDLEYLPKENRESIMKDLALFFAQSHAIPVDKVEPFFENTIHRTVRHCIAQLRPDFYEMDDRKRALLTDDVMRCVFPNEEFVFGHLDLRPKNFTLTEDLMHVRGVFDFGCAGINVPEKDVSSYIRTGETERMLIGAYERLTGRRLKECTQERLNLSTKRQRELMPLVRSALQHVRG